MELNYLPKTGIHWKSFFKLSKNTQILSAEGTNIDSLFER